MRRRKPEVESITPKQKTLYTLTLSEEQMQKLQSYLDRHLWEYYEVDHARYGFRHDKVNVVGYKSGKLVVQGKKTEEFITHILEPEITGEALLGYDEVHNPQWFEPHAGLDESGKGDLFGPVVAATVIADAGMVRAWMDAGIKDSKTISDKKILELEKTIRQTEGVVVETAWAGMEKYNELYAKFQNLNRMLAWFHARALESALDQRQVPWGLLDQFSKQPITKGMLKKHKCFDLRQQTKAESDPVVAAASVIARAQFLKALAFLEDKAGVKIPKGASRTATQTLKEIVEKEGPEAMPRFVKMHFKNVDELR